MICCSCPLVDLLFEKYVTEGRFPPGGIFRVERHFPLEDVMSMRCGLLLCKISAEKIPLGGAKKLRTVQLFSVVKLRKKI